jgi:hypothetical protein
VDKIQKYQAAIVLKPSLIHHFCISLYRTMDKLTGDQKAEYATSLAALALYDGGVSFSCAPKRLVVVL